MIREEEYERLKRLVQAWASFSRLRELDGAMSAFKAIERHDAAEVLRLGWVEERQRLGKPVNREK